VINFTTPFLYTGGDLLVTDTNPGTDTSFFVDAVSLPNSATDTSACFGGSTCAAQSFNSPVTEFLATPATSTVPEPSSLPLCVFLFGATVAGGAAARKRKSVS
jgi:PEP-CTERM motif